MRSLYARVRLLVEDLDARKDIIGDVQLEDPYCNYYILFFFSLFIATNVLILKLMMSQQLKNHIKHQIEFTSI